MFAVSRKRPVDQLDDSISYFDNSSPRSGKWTVEEEIFANKLIIEFEAGTLADCMDGCTLRAYLARKLNCAPMRISKKFAGQCIGKHAFAKKVHEQPSGLNPFKSVADKSTETIRSRSSSASSAAYSTISDNPDAEVDNTAVMRKAEISYNTLAEFQQSSLSQGAAPFPRYLISIGGALHPTALYPLRNVPSSVDPWNTFESRRPAAVARADSDSNSVGLDIDNVYGLRAHSVSTGFSSISPSSASTEAERYLEADRHTPDTSPGLVSPEVRLLGVSVPVPHSLYVTPVLPPLATVSECGSTAVKDGQKDRNNNEAEEWRAVLCYFTQPQGHDQGQGYNQAPPTLASSKGEPETGADMVRRDSSFLLHRSVSYSSLFV